MHSVIKKCGVAATECSVAIDCVALWPLSCVCLSVCSLHCLSPYSPPTPQPSPLPPPLPLEAFSSLIVLFMLLLYYFSRLLFVVKSILPFLLACDSLSRCYVKCNTTHCLFILRISMLRCKFFFHFIIDEEKSLIILKLLLRRIFFHIPPSPGVVVSTPSHESAGPS